MTPQQRHYQSHKNDPDWVQKKRSYFKKWSQENPRLEEGKIYREQVRREVLFHYGKFCACCGEDRYEFLALDHKNNDGNIHRKSIGKKGGYAIACWARKNNYPEIFRVLCHNCNMATAFYGKCPHDSP